MFINNREEFDLYKKKADRAFFKNKDYKKEKRKDILKNDNRELNKALGKLDKLIGLKEIKDLVKQYISYMQIQQLRKSYGLKKMPVVMHMIFKGNPGTGKTTVARILADIFKAIGYLEQGYFVEAERVDLVGEYIGHTAKKTKEMIKKAVGGILFIDEAYSLARGGEKDFGRESIDTLVKAMEDYKDNLIIIMAGYSSEMEEFLKINPGLRSRFALHLNFKDYTIDELVSIAEIMYQEREYKIRKNTRSFLYRFITLTRKNENDGNARMIRNLVEKSIRFQADRVIKKNVITKNDLMVIKKEDMMKSFRQEIEKIY